MIALAQSNLSYDFEAYNAAGQVWNPTLATPAFVTYTVADYDDYRIEATKQGNANHEDIKAWFYAADVSGAVRWQMRERGASLALSPIVWVGPDVTETVTDLSAIKAKTDLIGTIRSLIRW
jgi:hypothetical protein